MGNIEVCDNCGLQASEYYICECCQGDFCASCFLADIHLCDDCDADREEQEAQEEAMYKDA